MVILVFLPLPIPADRCETWNRSAVSSVRFDLYQPYSIGSTRSTRDIVVGPSL